MTAPMPPRKRIQLHFDVAPDTQAAETWYRILISNRSNDGE